MGIEKKDLQILREFILRLTEIDIESVDKIALTSAQKSRIASWCEDNQIEIPDLDNESFWLDSSIKKTTKNKFPNIPKSNVFNSIGIDIQSIKEFTKNIGKISKNNGELKKIFTLRELSHAESSSDPKQTLTGIFAAKEAIFKCIGSDSKNWSGIEIMHLDGKPIYDGIAISISHSEDFAIAVAVIYQDYEDLTKSNINDDNNERYLKLFLSFGAIGGILFILSFFLTFLA